MQPAVAEAKTSSVAGVGVRLITPLVLFALAAVGWWWSARMAGDMRMESAPTMGMDAMAGEHVLTLGAFIHLDFTDTNWIRYEFDWTNQE